MTSPPTRGRSRHVAGHRGPSVGRPAHGEETTRPKASSSSWTTRAAVLAAVATFVASLGALYYNGKSSRQATQQARLSERAQTSERFSRSVDELGSPSVTVRAGAVYAFGGLMRDGNRDDHAIVDILNSFVRLRSSRSTAVRPASTQAPADIAAALIVLRHHQMALAQTNLSGFDLRGADLTGADLTGANRPEGHAPDRSSAAQGTPRGGVPGRQPSQRQPSGACASQRFRPHRRQPRGSGPRGS
jgi:hypothetical protein